VPIPNASGSALWSSPRRDLPGGTSAAGPFSGDAGMATVEVEVDDLDAGRIHGIEIVPARKARRRSRPDDRLMEIQADECRVYVETTEDRMRILAAAWNACIGDEYEDFEHLRADMLAAIAAHEAREAARLVKVAV
jgi:hypothetical protein